jgi:hypothetical protein
MLDKQPVGNFMFIYYDNDKFLRLGFDRKITFKEEISDDDRPEKEITDLGK